MSIRLSVRNVSTRLDQLKNYVERVDKSRLEM